MVILTEGEEGQLQTLRQGVCFAGGWKATEIFALDSVWAYFLHRLVPSFSFMLLSPPYDGASQVAGW